MAAQGRAGSRGCTSAEQQLQKGSKTWIRMESAAGFGISGKGGASGHSCGQQSLQGWCIRPSPLSGDNERLWHKRCWPCRVLPLASRSTKSQPRLSVTMSWGHQDTDPRQGQARSFQHSTHTEVPGKTPALLIPHCSPLTKQALLISPLRPAQF